MIFLVPHVFQKYIQTAMIITVINFRYAEDTTLRAESKELKSLMTRVKEESENAGLKLNIQKTKIMATGSITSQQIDGGKVETVTDFIFLGSKITVDGDWNHEIKRCLLLGRKVMTNLDSILKSRDITLPIEVHIVKAVFSSSHVQIWELDCRRLSPEELIHWNMYNVSNCGAAEDSWESLGQQEDQTSQS